MRRLKEASVHLVWREGRGPGPRSKEHPRVRGEQVQRAVPGRPRVRVRAQGGGPRLPSVLAPPRALLAPLGPALRSPRAPRSPPEVPLISI